MRLQLDRLLESNDFRYSERLSRFLKFVVEQQLAGNAAQLKETVLAVEIFDRSPSYDSHVDSIVRVEARRLRSKLERYYGDAGRGDPVRVDLPKGSYAPVFTSNQPVPAPAVPRRVSLRVLAAVAAACVLGTFAFTRWMGGRRMSPGVQLRRITSDAGLTFQPALSPDGRLIAYASDSGGTDHFEIWVQQVEGGRPIRLTNSPSENLEPAFSPDGTVIAYHARGEQGGIYQVPALGGMSTLLAREGCRPRFSPDGHWVAYWTGESSFMTSRVYIMPSKGGAPVRLQPGFTYAAHPVWSPDGRHVMFVGSRSPAPKPWESSADDWDWWVAPTAGGTAVQTFARKALTEQGLAPPLTFWPHRRVVPAAWAASGHVVFSARSGDQVNVWRLPLSAAMRISGPAEPLTFGTGRQDEPSVSAAGSLAFAALTCKSDIWSLPIDADAAEVRGAPHRLTSDSADYQRPSVSRDGRRLAFLSNRAGNLDVWTRDLATGKEQALTTTREDEMVVILSPDGSQAAYGYGAPLPESVYTMPFAGGRAAQWCADCGEPRSWLAAGDGLLFQRRGASGFSQVELLNASGRQGIAAQSSGSALFSAAVSPDNRWLALAVRTPPNEHRILVAPFDGRAAASRDQWIAVTEPGIWVDKPRWSPGGGVLYYLCDRDGFLCPWAQKLDPATRRPVGPPRAMGHFHGRASLASVFGTDLSVASDKLVFNLGETAGNVWLAPAAR